MPLITGRQVTFPRKRHTGLTDKECFLMWVETGSLRKVVITLERKGVTNKNTGKPFSYETIRLAAKRYILTHPDEARPIILKAWEDDEVEISDDDWNEYLVKMAASVFGSVSKPMFMNWIKEHGFERYDYIYADQFGLTPKYTRPVSV